MTPKCGKVGVCRRERGFIRLVQAYRKITTFKSFKLKTVFHYTVYIYIYFFFPLGARNVYHQLFMSSLLMDLKYKKLFAIQFAKVRYLVPLDIYCIISKHGRQTSFPDGLTNVIYFFIFL